MTDRIASALDGLSPGGLALKRHILARLLVSAPKSLTATQAARGGPRRTFASVWYALKALQRIGVVTHEDAEGGTTHYRLAMGTEDVVRTFLANEQKSERQSVSPLPGLPRYQRVLKVLHDTPQQSFTVVELCDKLRRKDVAVRRSVQELHEAGYVTQDLPDQDAAGRPHFHYRLNPHAMEYASVLLLGAVEGT